MFRSLLALILFAAIALVACSSGVSESLQPCSFTVACPSGEICNVSQSCGPLPDGGDGCGPLEGDQRCHRSCADGGACPDDESCRSALLFERSDFAGPKSVCLPDSGKGS